jgi:hypothetical protein
VCRTTAASRSGSAGEDGEEDRDCCGGFATCRNYTIDSIDARSVGDRDVYWYQQPVCGLAAVFSGLHSSQEER